MKTETGYILNQLFFEYITLYHQKVGVVFTIENETIPKCNKNQRKALLVIKQQKRMIQTDLGRCLDMSKGALTSLLDFLEESELIKREGDPKDRRKTWVELSEKGEKYTDSQLALYEAGVVEIFRETDDVEILRTLESLRQLINLMKKL
ncbi:MAG: MarR family winged helix-turn-helix transcriptional regulator [Desulfitobacteriaceae bacterium]